LRDELQALDLAKVGGVAEHVDVEEFGDIVVSSERVCRKSKGVSTLLAAVVVV
jgi:hypothetical protein